MKSISLPSYAKVNFGLLVKGQRSDGFHEIETILQQIDLKDKISLRLRSDEKVTLSCTRPDIPTDETNLCVLAANYLKEATGRSFGVDIQLRKIIPVGAGLGGGSSNAAVVLLGLNRLVGLGLAVSELEVIASRIGSDVPFFIQGGTALATGRGEIIKPLEGVFLNRPLVVVFPGFSVSTQWAYGNLSLDLTINKKCITLLSFKGGDVNEQNLFDSAVNDFEKNVFSKHPELSEIKRVMTRCGAVYASLSGSGSALFGVFDCDEDVQRARSSLPDHCAVFPARFARWGISQIE